MTEGSIEIIVSTSSTEGHKCKSGTVSWLSITLHGVVNVGSLFASLIDLSPSLLLYWYYSDMLNVSRLNSLQANSAVSCLLLSPSTSKSVKISAVVCMRQSWQPYGFLDCLVSIQRYRLLITSITTYKR